MRGHLSRTPLDVLRNCRGTASAAAVHFCRTVHSYDKPHYDGTWVPFARQIGNGIMPDAEARDVGSAHSQLRKNATFSQARCFTDRGR